MARNGPFKKYTFSFTSTLSLCFVFVIYKENISHVYSNCQGSIVVQRWDRGPLGKVGRLITFSPKHVPLFQSLKTVNDFFTCVSMQISIISICNLATFELRYQLLICGLYFAKSIRLNSLTILLTASLVVSSSKESLRKYSRQVISIYSTDNHPIYFFML